jgi:hypothetical protein
MCEREAAQLLCLRNKVAALEQHTIEEVVLIEARAFGGSRVARYGLLVARTRTRREPGSTQRAVIAARTRPEPTS